MQQKLTELYKSTIIKKKNLSPGQTQASSVILQGEWGACWSPEMGCWRSSLWHVVFSGRRAVGWQVGALLLDVWGQKTLSWRKPTQRAGAGRHSPRPRAGGLGKARRGQGQVCRGPGVREKRARLGARWVPGLRGPGPGGRRTPVGSSPSSATRWSGEQVPRAAEGG